MCIRDSDYTPAEMEQIVAFHARKNDAILSDELRAALPNFCENWVNLAGTEWNNAREAVNLLDDMMRNWKRDPDAQSVTDEHGHTCLLYTSAVVVLPVPGLPVRRKWIISSLGLGWGRSG